VAGRLRMDMASYRDLAAFAQFGSDLDKETQAQLDRGHRLTELLKQPQYVPVPLHHQVISIYAGTRGYADKVPVEKIKNWEAALLLFMDTQYPQVGQGIIDTFKLTEENEAILKEAIEAFSKGWEG
ncbi:MAG: F0F1 ATP synthase subunit alpha, partial [Anaerolineales bacterium]|nr:F0F1 ATP synthase subunit alpha [Anaerolineales bacterium]